VSSLIFCQSADRWCCVCAKVYNYAR